MVLDAHEVRPVSSNLSTSRPDKTPHLSVTPASFDVGMFTVNSPFWPSSSYEYREGRIDTESMGGSEHIMPVQAIVITLGFPLLSTVVTRTAGKGINMVPGFQCSLLFCLGCGGNGVFFVGFVFICRAYTCNELKANGKR